jgi:hypothetical protein
MTCKFSLIVKIKQDVTEFLLVKESDGKLSTIITYTLTPPINKVFTSKTLFEMEKQELKDSITVYLYVSLIIIFSKSLQNC